MAQSTLSLLWTQEQVSLSSLSFSMCLITDQAKLISKFLCASDYKLEYAT